MYVHSPAKHAFFFQVSNIYHDFSTRSILHEYFNPLSLLVLMGISEYLRSPAKNLSFFAGYLADWQ